jgi:hypothetical protein
MLRTILARLYFVVGALGLIVSIICIFVNPLKFGLSITLFVMGGWAVIGWILSPYLFKKDSQD